MDRFITVYPKATARMFTVTPFLQPIDITLSCVLEPGSVLVSDCPAKLSTGLCSEGGCRNYVPFQPAALLLVYLYTFDPSAAVTLTRDFLGTHGVQKNLVGIGRSVVGFIRSIQTAALTQLAVARAGREKPGPFASPIINKIRLSASIF